MCTYTCQHEFIGLIYSLSLHHPGAKFYCMLDTQTKQVLDNLTLKPNLNIVVKVDLDKYTGLNRHQMEEMNIIKEFWNNKANIISYALEYEKDTIFLDSDVFILNPINCIDETKDVGLSPHYIKKETTDEVGYFNGGCVWTKNKQVPLCWKKHTVKSRYVDQASLEDVAMEYKKSMFTFGEEINVMPWRMIVGDPNYVKKCINIQNNNIRYKNSPLSFIHTHFLDGRFKDFNLLIVKALMGLRRYKELAIIQRIINNNWLIKLPIQPKPGIWKHANDSFRELVKNIVKNNTDVNVTGTNSGHCWLAGNICLYDRPTTLWYNEELLQSSLFLLGNGDINIEGEPLKQQKIPVKPWIFWPRNPIKYETYLDNNPRKLYKERQVETIFIGNIENDTQNNFRNTTLDWGSVLSEYHCTKGTQHKFTPEQYMHKLSNAKFGLALRGYGSKCHREVELMGLGTVPIITPEVSITSYMDPPEEGKHFIRCNNPKNLKEILSKITEEEWEVMSKNCYEWYQKNVHSKNCFKNFLNNILYN
tara:strand:- start:37 stop:1632 length:1596 start_codon:yes stop_codon:yes gene_type:complete